MASGDVMHTATEILNHALALSEPERAALALQLLRSLEPEGSDPDTEPAWEAEIESRLERIDRGQFAASDWREAIARIRQALSQGPSS
jgi:putative addiction module component (TIGR02574 family)